MKKVLLAVALTAVLTGCTSVEPGYVGILVNRVGGEKGVDQQEVGPGRYFLTINQDIYTFPTFSQTQVWTKNINEGSDKDDSMSFQTSEGLAVNADIGITYAINPNKVSNVFQKYRKGIDEITHNYLRSIVRDALVTEASKRPIESVYGSGKGDLMDAVKARVVRETAEIGIIVENIYWIGDLRLPESVVAAINAKIGATQQAAQSENQVAKARADAQQAIETARGVAESTMLQAKAEAAAINLKGEALRNNPKLVDWSAVEKWDGKLPEYMLGDSTPFINLNKQ
jgi:regulator of protease activity HflC (stomatin/prohibitin superfamily)